MPAPLDVGTFTERLYLRLPELYQAADEQQTGPTFPLLRYLALLGDQASTVDALVDRFHPATNPDGTSDLANPATADPAWLPWLAQLTGVDLADVTDVTARRELIADAAAVRANGSEGALVAAVREHLTGTRSVYVYSHAAGDPWRVAIVTHPAELATSAAELIAAANAHKPAGVLLEHTFGLIWQDLEADYPTWSAIDASGSWAGLVPV